MRFYKIYPEVPASFGERTVFDRSTVPLFIDQLHINFEGWLGSDLMELSPIFFVTRSLGLTIRSQSLSGISHFDIIEIEKSENFVELYPGKEVPECELLRIDGKPFIDDFGLDKGYLIVSERANNLLHQHNLSGVEIEEIQLS